MFSFLALELRLQFTYLVLEDCYLRKGRRRGGRGEVTRRLLAGFARVHLILKHVVGSGEVVDLFVAFCEVSGEAKRRLVALPERLGETLQLIA